MSRRVRNSRLNRARRLKIFSKRGLAGARVTGGQRDRKIDGWLDGGTKRDENVGGKEEESRRGRAAVDLFVGSSAAMAVVRRI